MSPTCHCFYASSLYCFLPQDSTLWILTACAFASLVVGVLTEGWHEGWYDGVGVLLSIILVVAVTAISDYRQSVQVSLYKGNHCT